MKNLTLICEAQVTLGQDQNESQAPSGIIEARATTWGAREGADGRKFFYKPEGFADWAKEFSQSGKPLPMFLNHNDAGMPVGEWTEFVFDEKGMTGKGRLFLNTIGGSDLYTVLKESPSLFGGVSVGAYADEYCWVKENGEPMMMGSDEYEDAFFQITKGGFQEVSVVMYPNNPNAEIQKLEFFDSEGHPNPRNIEKVLRDAGLSRKDATTASSILKRIIDGMDVKAPSESEQETITITGLSEETPNQSESDAVDIQAELIRAIELRELEKALSKRIQKD